MINEAIVKGSKETTLHTFSVSQKGMDIIITPGAYYRGGKKFFESREGGVISIPLTDEPLEYEIWLGKEGIYVYSHIVGESYEPKNLDDLYDRLCWFNLSESDTSLDDVEITVLKVVEK